MPVYELKSEALAAKTQQSLAAIAMEVVLDPTGQRVLVRSQEELPGVEGIVEVAETEFQNLLAVQPREEASQMGRPVAGGSWLEASTRWTVDPHSPRKAAIHWVAVGRDRQALGIRLGEGRGDRVEVGRDLSSGLQFHGVTLDVRPAVEDLDLVAVAVTLTSSTERPWLTRGPTEAPSHAWTTLRFEFGDEDPQKLARVNRLVLGLHTDADRGFCMIKDLSLLG